MEIAATIVFFILLIGIAVFIGLKIKAKRDLEAKMKWVVPFPLLESILPDAERTMIANGFGKDDYVLNVKDCSEYAPEWKKTLAWLLAPHRPNGQTEWIKCYSFQRDPREDGTDPGRHQVTAIKTTGGMKFIDTYRINGSLFRELSETELKAGYFI